MGIVLEKLDIENFGEFSELSVEFDRGVNYLIGDNGSGKSTILNAIWTTMQGMGERGRNIFHSERWRWIGPDRKSADGQLVLYDEEEDVRIIVKNHFTKDGNNIEVFAEEGILPEDFIENIWNTFCVDPEQFAKLDPKEQAIELGIDTSEFDQEIADLKTERRDAKRDLKKQLNVVEKYEEEGIEEVERVNLDKVLAQKDEIEDFNAVQQWLKEVTAPANFSEFLNNVAIKESELDTLNWEWEIGENIELEPGKFNEEFSYREADYKMQRSILAFLIDYLPEPEEEKDLSAINEKIQNAQNINNQADRWEKYQEEKGVLAGLKEAVDGYNEVIEQVEQSKTKYVQGQDLPFSNMSIGEDGGLLFNDRPIQDPYYSTGEIWAIVLNILAETDPDMRFFFVRNATNLDEKKRKTIQKLAERGYQPIFEIVGSESQEGGRSIFLKEGEVAVSD